MNKLRSQLAGELLTLLIADCSCCFQDHDSPLQDAIYRCVLLAEKVFFIKSFYKT